MIEYSCDFSSNESLTSLAHQIRAMADSEEVLLIPGGGKFCDRLGWTKFLSENCKLKIDRRHFDRKSVSKFNHDDKLDPADWWEISYQPDKATAYAFSNTRQPLHTDNVWFSNPPEINFFIMEKQSDEGGEQTIYPVSRLLADLQNEDPNLLRDLTSIKVRIKKGDEEIPNITEIIKLGPQPRISWNYYRTEKNSKSIAKMCEMFFKFLERKESTPSVERIRAITGDCFCFHDQKMLHGRTAFKATQPFERILFHSAWKFPEFSS